MPRLIDAEALRPWISKAVMGWIDKEPTACCETCKWWGGNVCGNKFSEMFCSGMYEGQVCECWELNRRKNQDGDE